MSYIPENVMRLAFALVDANNGKDVTSTLIARAIMTERERCAQTAEEYGDKEVTDTRDVEQMIQQVAAQEAAYEIADLIRKAETA